MKKLIQKTFILFLFLLCFAPITSFAADVSFNADKNTFLKNEDFLVQVFVDTKDVNVNAIEGSIKFPSDLLDLKEVRDGNSSINFWVEKPHITGDGDIFFSSITTGGFSGPHRFLFSLVFHSKNSGSGKFIFNNIQILKNDGLGTKVDTTVAPFSFSISGEENGPNAGNLFVKDVDKPEVFIPFIGNDADMFDGKKFLVFSTVDKGSGIDHYEVKESFWGWGGEYINTPSPYVLKDQTLKSRIDIKAIDKAGNVREAMLLPQNKMALLELGLILGIILTVCIFLLVFFRKKIWQKYTL